jgi:hypothetical protein
MKVTRSQLRKIILENLYIKEGVLDVLRDAGNSAYEYMFGDDSSEYTPGQIVTTSDEDPYDYKEVDGRWVYRQRDTEGEWKNVNSSGSEILNRQFKQEETQEENDRSPTLIDRILGPIIEAPVRAGTAAFPIYVVGLSLFMSGKSRPFTENSLSKPYKVALAGMSKYAMQHYRGVVGGGNIEAYKKKYTAMARALGEGQPGSPLINNEDVLNGSGLVEDYIYFLGQFSVKDEGDSYLIVDNYDFNNFENDPEYFSKVINAWKELKEGLKKIYANPSQRQVYNLIRRMVTFRHGTGYTGYPIKIRLSKDLAPEFSNNA